MNDKKLTYRQHLEKFPNCPPADFKEVERKAYRWTHNPLTTHDFLPVSLISEPPARMLDDFDKMCMAYGLSMFDTRENSFAKYQKEWNRRRTHQREQFKEDKGNHIALLALTMDDGIADDPNQNNHGHFTFYEYSETDLGQKAIELINIFNDNGEFNIQ